MGRGWAPLSKGFMRTFLCGIPPPASLVLVECLWQSGSGVGVHVCAGQLVLVTCSRVGVGGSAVDCVGQGPARCICCLLCNLCPFLCHALSLGWLAWSTMTVNTDSHFVICPNFFHKNGVHEEQSGSSATNLLRAGHSEHSGGSLVISFSNKLCWQPSTISTLLDTASKHCCNPHPHNSKWGPQSCE